MWAFLYVHEWNWGPSSTERERDMDHSELVSRDSATDDYEPPRLELLGSIAQLTHGAGAGIIDALFGADGGLDNPPIHTSVTGDE